MKRMQSVSCLFLFMLVLACSKHQQDQQKDYSSHPRNAEYTSILNNYREGAGAPGTVIAIGKGEENIWIGASGISNLEKNTAFTTITQFRTGSITKVFTAVIFMKLKEQDKISLDDNLQNLLPEVAGEIPSADKITVRQLLNHTNGIFDPKNEDENYQMEIMNDPGKIYAMTIDEKLAAYVYGKPLHFEPGTAAGYSNGGYWLLGKIAERITGKTMQQLMDELIFAPLKMRNSYYEKRSYNNISRGYSLINNDPVDVSVYDAADGDGDPGSGVISNAGDLVTFATALFRGHLVSPASLAEMEEIVQFPACPGGDCGYGLGLENWNTAQNSGYGKNGTSVGVEANMVYFPAKNTVIVCFLNQGSGSDKNWFDTVLN